MALIRFDGAGPGPNIGPIWSLPGIGKGLRILPGRCRSLRRSNRSKLAHEKQHDQDDQNEADDTDAAMAEAVAVAAEAATEATQQEDDKDDDEYESNRHDLSPVAHLRTLSLSHSDCEAPVRRFPLLLLYGKPLPILISMPAR